MEVTFIPGQLVMVRKDQTPSSRWLVARIVEMFYRVFSLAYILCLRIIFYVLEQTVYMYNACDVETGFFKEGGDYFLLLKLKK